MAPTKIKRNSTTTKQNKNNNNASFFLVVAVVSRFVFRHPRARFFLDRYLPVTTRYRLPFSIDTALSILL